MYICSVNTFPEYLLERIQEFERDKGERTSLDKFAEYIGVSRPLVSHWLKGKYSPSLENVRTLAELFGPEIYEVLQLPAPDPDLELLKSIWKHIPEEKRRSLREQGESYAAHNQTDTD